VSAARSFERALDERLNPPTSRGDSCLRRFLGRISYRGLREGRLRVLSGANVLASWGAASDAPATTAGRSCRIERVRQASPGSTAGFVKRLRVRQPAAALQNEPGGARAEIFSSGSDGLLKCGATKSQASCACILLQAFTPVRAPGLALWRLPQDCAGACAEVRESQSHRKNSACAQATRV
jgi:hypothetical protein